MRAVVAITALVSATTAARADSPQPVLASDDVRTHGPVARHIVEGAVGYELGVGPAADDDVGLWTFQLAVGPKRFTGKAGELFDWTKAYSLRVRWTAVDAQMESGAGPMTVALHRYLPFEPLEFVPLLHLHAGLTFAVGTPWLRNRAAASPQTLRETHAVDSELRASGWSVRPADAFVRLDFLACRAFHAELGVGPELFEPGTGGPAEYGVRGHVQLGFKLSCPHRATSLLHHVGVLGEYRARGRLYADGAPFEYHDVIAASLQIDAGPLTFGPFINFYPGDGGYLAIGGRVQLGVWGSR
jgi:hypothetical protein